MAMIDDEDARRRIKAALEGQSEQIRRLVTALTEYYGTHCDWMKTIKDADEPDCISKLVVQEKSYCAKLAGLVDMQVEEAVYKSIIERGDLREFPLEAADGK